MKIRHRKFLTSAAAPFPVGSAAIAARGHPNRPVRVIVPFAFGIPTDVLARLIVHKRNNWVSNPSHLRTDALNEAPSSILPRSPIGPRRQGELSDDMLQQPTPNARLLSERNASGRSSVAQEAGNHQPIGDIR